MSLRSLSGEICGSTMVILCNISVSLEVGTKIMFRVMHRPATETRNDEGIMLSEVSQTDKETLYDLTYL